MCDRRGTHPKRQYVLHDHPLKVLACLALLVHLLARLARVHQLDASARQGLQELGEHELLVRFGFGVLGLFLLVCSVDTAEDVVDLRDRDRDLAILDKLHPLALGQRVPVGRAFGRRSATLGVLKEERRCEGGKTTKRVTRQDCDAGLKVKSNPVAGPTQSCRTNASVRAASL